jgi:hypothetical protein
MVNRRLFDSQSVNQADGAFLVRQPGSFERKSERIQLTSIVENENDVCGFKYKILYCNAKNQIGVENSLLYEDCFHLTARLNFLRKNKRHTNKILE